MEYYVDKERLETFVSEWKRNQWLRFVLLFSAMLLVLAAVAQYSKTDIPPRVYLVSTATAIIVTLVSTLLLARDMMRFAGTRYSIDLAKNSVRAEGAEPRIFPFDKIATIDRRRYGTLLIRGTRILGFRFPPGRGRRHYRFRNSDVLFIPAATSQYEELIDRIKELAP